MTASLSPSTRVGTISVGVQCTVPTGPWCSGSTLRIGEISIQLLSPANSIYNPKFEPPSTPKHKKIHFQAPNNYSKFTDLSTNELILKDSGSNPGGPISSFLPFSANQFSKGRDESRTAISDELPLARVVDGNTQHTSCIVIARTCLSCTLADPPLQAIFLDLTPFNYRPLAQNQKQIHFLALKPGPWDAVIKWELETVDPDDPGAPKIRLHNLCCTEARVRRLRSQNCPQCL